MDTVIYQQDGATSHCSNVHSNISVVTSLQTTYLPSYGPVMSGTFSRHTAFGLFSVVIPKR